MLQQILLTEPVPGTTMVCPINADNMVIGLMFAPACDGLRQSGQDLEFLFPHEGRVVLQGFFDHAADNTLPHMILDDGSVLKGSDLLVDCRGEPLDGDFGPEGMYGPKNPHKPMRGVA